MRAIRNGFVTLLVLAAIGAGLYGWWTLDLRWRPHDITQDQAQIGKILRGSGWVSPGLSGPKLYLIAYRDCIDCVRYQTDEFPKLQAAGVDTRVVMVARDDLNGVSRSTPADRATVAELWVNRSWGLYRKWIDAPAETWTAPGLPQADGDVARSAVVEVSHDTVDRMAPLLKDNGIAAGYPILVWWTKDGLMRGCVCGDARTYGFVRKDLGVQ